jgi:hypothetical protein
MEKQTSQIMYGTSALAFDNPLSAPGLLCCQREVYSRHIVMDFGNCRLL